MVEEESNLLRETEQVKILCFQNLSGLKGATQFFFSIWNTRAARTIKSAINTFNPDVIHLHNWHYSIGPIVVRVAKKMGVPIVLTVHNFRLICPSAILLHRDSLFLDSIHVSFPWKAVKNKVYRNSWAQTFWLAFVNWFHKEIGTWKMIDRLVFLTGFSKNIFLSSTLEIENSKISIKPNFIQDPGIKETERKDFFLFVGRLSVEKGVLVLLEAFKISKNKLCIVGDGPLKQKVLDACGKSDNISYAGRLPRNEVLKMMSECSALIFPSIWYEGMPMTLIEAFAEGTPVIASDIGAMSFMIKDGYNGIHFSAGNPVDLAAKVDTWSSLPRHSANQFSKRARLSYLENYTPEKNKKMLLAIYTEVINNKSTS